MKEKRIHVKKIGKEIAAKTGVPQSYMNTVIDAICLGIVEHLQNGEAVSLPNIGRFIPHDKAARPARNPQTGERIEIPEHRVIKFRPSLALKRYIS